MEDHQCPHPYRQAVCCTWDMTGGSRQGAEVNSPAAKAPALARNFSFPHIFHIHVLPTKTTLRNIPLAQTSDNCRTPNACTASPHSKCPITHRLLHALWHIYVRSQHTTVLADAINNQACDAGKVLG